MTRLGDILRSARERRGASLDEIAASTKIRRHYLEALETNDLESLPGEVFVRGYLKTIAGLLDADPERLLRAYAEERRRSGAAGREGELGDRETAKAVLEGLARTRGVRTAGGDGRRRWIWIAAAVVATVAIGVAIWAVRPTLVRPSAPATRAAQPARSPETGPPEKADSPEPPAARPPVEAGRAEAAEPEPVLAETNPAPRRAEPFSAEAVPSTAGDETGAAGEPAPQSARPATAGGGEEPAPPAPPRLRVPDHGVGTAVVDRTLVGRGDRFPEGSVVWFWNRVVDGQRGDSIRHVWKHEGRVAGIATLSIGGTHWRTQSRRELPVGATGTWTVEARDASDRVLATSTFTCEPAP